MADKDILANVCSILETLRPIRDKNVIKCEKLSGGLTNTMYLVKIDQTPKFVYRVNGFGTEKLVDRIEEKNVLQLAGDAGICPQVAYIDEKVMLQEYCPGETLGLSSIRDSRIHKLIARKLAAFHLLPVDQSSKPWFTKTLKSYLLELDDKKMSQLGDELLGKIESRDGRLTMCHNDLRLNNVIYENGDNFFFIDFEYAAVNFPEYDIAHYFWQHEGAQTASDFQTLNMEHRKLFIAEYFLAFHEKSPTEQEVDQILQRITIFEAANHFLWSVWSLIQHRFGRSDEQFCYIKNSDARFAKYQECLQNVKI